MATIAQNLQTIANGVDTIKNNLGLSESASLSDVVTKSASVIEPTGTISITENGTVDVTNYASASVEVSGGSTATDYAELKAKINGASEDFIAYVKNLPNNYTSATLSPVTLYTPHSEYQYYVIQKRSNGNYRLVWFKDIPAVHVNGSNLTFGKTSLNMYYSSADIAPTFTTLEGTESSAPGFYSDEYSTAATIVEKMQQNELTYTSITSGFSGVKDGDNIAAFCNAPMFNDATLKFETNFTKISSNETISAPPHTEIEYIQSSGTQYIDTGFQPNQNTRVVMQVSNTSRRAYWFGAWNNAYNDGAYACANDYTNIYIGYDGQGQGYGTYVTGDNTIDFNKNVLSINNNVIQTFTPTNFQVNYNMYLFCQDRKGTASWGDAGGSQQSFRLHSCKIYDNDVLIRDFIPVKDPTNVVCLFDLVTEAYFYNLGTGTFGAGPEV